jgi:hypothetical protein
MRFLSLLKTGALLAASCLFLHGQTPSPADVKTDAKGLPPRAAPTDYQGQAQAGATTVAAEFKGHSVPTATGTLSTEDYVVVELGLFGAPGARVKLSAESFSLRVNGKKAALPTQPYGMVIGGVKDPEWEPPAAAPKSKTSMGGGGRGEQGESNGPPPPVKIPIEVQRAMALKVQKAALPEGDRALPIAGLIFFQYRGKTSGIHSLELVYTGAEGKATLTLQP